MSQPSQPHQSHSAPADRLSDLETESARLVAAGHFEQAAQLWIAAMAQSEDRARLVRYKLGYCQFLRAASRYDEAQAILQELYEIQRHASILHQLGQIALSAGDFVGAQAWLLREAAELAPEDALAQARNALAQGRALLYEHAQEAQQAAIAQLRRCILQSKAAKAPQLEGQARYLLGELAQQLGELELARFYYASAYEAYEQADDEAAMLELATCLNQLP